MKILLLNYEFPPLGGGASPVSHELAKNYTKLGHQVTVVTMGYKDLKAYEEIDEIKIHRVKCLRSKKELCHPWEQLSYLFSAKKFLKKHLKNHDYDINHTHFIIPTGILALWLKKRCQLPYIVTSHGSDVPGFNDDRFKLLHKFTGGILKKVSKNAEKIVAPSIFLKELILKNISKNLESKVEHIPNGLDLKRFTPKKKKKIILSTGRLLERKGFQYLIKAVSSKKLDYEVHIAGDGPMMAELKKLAAESKTKIVFHGWLDNKSKKYKDLLESADIYCLVSSKENASIALLEAMSAGCAVITANSSGCIETVGESGLCIEVKNSKALIETINRLIENPDLMKNLQKAAVKKVHNQYNWSTIGKSYIKLLKQYAGR